jgi:hypothetical protein
MSIFVGVKDYGILSASFLFSGPLKEKKNCPNLVIPSPLPQRKRNGVVPYPQKINSPTLLPQT